jgi:hypothetical protein
MIYRFFIYETPQLKPTINFERNLDTVRSVVVYYSNEFNTKI